MIITTTDWNIIDDMILPSYITLYILSCHLQMKTVSNKRYIKILKFAVNMQRQPADQNNNRNKCELLAAYSINA